MATLNIAALHQEMRGNKTATMTVRETNEYLAKQQAKGWPGSLSITGRPVKRGPSRLAA